ncbi:MAG: serine/threonine protein kinase [Anaerolineales bacterium]|nr:serine/threonine protein kinase [Anaerolineales bacterium]
MSDELLLNNRYQIESRLGSGGMAVVYKAHDLMLERTVAVKVLREDFSSDPAFRERFHQEAKAAANLAHSSIVTIHDFGLDSGRLFIVMEYLTGTDLKSLIQSRGRFTVDETLPLLIQACAGIGYAHRAGLVHCDVKPQNMIVTPDQRLKVADFGIARALASIHPDEKSSVVWGSPQYFSPEQAAGEAPSPASDVYSLGIVMYEMLAGRLPFTSDSATDLSRQHRLEPPPPPRRFEPSIPPALEEIILKVLAKEPSARYRTADQLGRVLMTFSRTTTFSAVSEIVRTPPTKASPIKPSPQQTSRKQSSRPTLSPTIPPPQAATAPPPRPAYITRSSASPPAQQENPLDIDWSTWLLGLFALLAVGGLIPFWLWIYLLYNSPGR